METYSGHLFSFRLGALLNHLAHNLLNVDAVVISLANLNMQIEQKKSSKKWYKKGKTLNLRLKETQKSVFAMRMKRWRALFTEAVDKLLPKATSAPSFGRNLKKMI